LGYEAAGPPVRPGFSALCLATLEGVASGRWPSTPLLRCGFKSARRLAVSVRSRAISAASIPRERGNSKACKRMVPPLREGTNVADHRSMVPSGRAIVLPSRWPRTNSSWRSVRVPSSPSKMNSVPRPIGLSEVLWPDFTRGCQRASFSMLAKNSKASSGDTSSSSGSSATVRYGTPLGKLLESPIPDITSQNQRHPADNLHRRVF
jgi:hypothetical protein